MLVTPAFERMRQKDHCKLKVSFGYSRILNINNKTSEMARHGGGGFSSLHLGRVRQAFGPLTNLILIVSSR